MGLESMRFKLIRETGTFVDIYLMARTDVDVVDLLPDMSSFFGA